MKKILITGGAGFIGSHVVRLFVTKYPDAHIFNLDKLTYAGNLENITDVENASNYTFLKGDIVDSNYIQSIFEEHQFDSVIHLAAESHVDRSISNPLEFVMTNVVGTVNLLNAAKHIWKDHFDNKLFYHVSTDEVYGSLGETGMFTETTPYAPNSPYSASKASSDFIVRSYFHTYGMNVVTTNCSNNYGPKQHDEKLIPTIIRKALSGDSIPIYGDGKNVRDWLYVDDHCIGIDLVFNKGNAGETYIIGGKNERNNLYIANTVCDILDEIYPKGKSYKNQINFVKDRPGHDFRYAIDAAKIEKELRWEARENFETGIRKTINWYIEKYKK